ncbi:hypothetical protein HK097_005610 [Rhizophlyctis rosea]|uniref:NYN domain-containing protein n=1 Tax=Rhizophlyctis rosea TaxID=64517 RepID=A0AAD5SE84_9FUNG|nr:hypothetical protein HK097_005610 [Rhizophlyctis rosea]
MMLFAIHNPAPAVIVLISGDGDFSYALSLLNGLQYTIVLVVNNPNAPPVLQNAAQHVLQWRLDVLKVEVNAIAQEVNAEDVSLAGVAPAQPAERSETDFVPTAQTTSHTLDTTPVTSPASRTTQDNRINIALAPPPTSLSRARQGGDVGDVDEVASQNEEDNFGDLIHVLRGFLAEGVPRPQRSKVQMRLLTRNPVLYQRDSVLRNFKQYSTAAEKAGYVVKGGTSAAAWIALA